MVAAAIALLGALPAVAAAGVPPRGDTALLPADGFNGWKKTGNLRVFTDADLYGYIDGGAELFLEFGFEQLTQQRYAKAGGEFTVDLYRMSDPTASLGVYLFKCGNESPRAGFAARHTVNRHQLMFQRDRYFVILSSGTGQEALVPDLVAFGKALAGNMPASRPLPALTLLSKAGQAPGTLRLIRGPFGLQPIYTLGDGDILQLGGKLTAVSAEYRDPTLGAHTRIAAVYPTGAAAAKAFAWLAAHLDSYLKPTEKGPARLAFRDYQNKFGVVTLAGPRLDIVVRLDKAPAANRHP